MSVTRIDAVAGKPQSPDEVPSFPSDPAPQQQPAETPPISPDYDQPDRAPSETPPPPD